MIHIFVYVLCYVLVFLLSALKPLQLHIPVTGPFEQQRLNHRAICRTKSPRMETGRAAFLPQELLLTRTTHQMQATTDRSLAPDWFLCEMASKCILSIYLSWQNFSRCSIFALGASYGSHHMKRKQPLGPLGSDRFS